MLLGVAFHNTVFSIYWLSLIIVAPIYENIANQVKQNPNLIIAEYDATKNENE